jgi:hypothetical protein
MSFYVYRLIDPRDGSTFYIGKGTGKRAWSHEIEARAGRVVNRTKHNKIMAILGASLSVGVEIVANFNDERLAFAHEWDLIQNLVGLTNIVGRRDEGSEPPPTPDEIIRARIEARRQQSLRNIESQYAAFIKGQPGHLRQVAAEWVADLRKNYRESIPVEVPVARPSGAGCYKRKPGRNRRKYKRSIVVAKQLADLPPRLS